MLPAAARSLLRQPSFTLVVGALSTQAYTVTLNLSPDWRVFAFATAIGALTTLLFGVGPAFRAVRVSAAEVLRASTSRISAGRAPGGSVLVAQVAMTITLVVIGGLLGQTFLTLARVDPGFDREGSMIVTIDTARSTISPAVRGELFGRAADAVAAVPGVVAAASQTMPSGSFRSTPLVEVPGAPPMSPDNRFLYGNAITPGWFHTLGIGFVAGRDFNARDQQGTAPVAIVNAAFVHRFYQEPNVVGKTIFRLRGQPARREPLEIVGVVNDAIYQSVREPAPSTLFVPVAQAGSQPLPTFSLTVRSADRQPERLTKSVADALAALDPTLIFSFRSLTDQIDSAFRQEQLLAALSAFFGALALVLAALGMYGVTLYGVARRRFEIGVRMALGASRASVMRLVIGRVALLATLGVALGALFSALVTQFIAALLLGVSARDLSTFVAAAAVVLSASALAVWRPALRAASVDAAKVLRDG
jgi:putative ABC transport system permease protein